MLEKKNYAAAHEAFLAETDTSLNGIAAQYTLEELKALLESKLQNYEVKALKNQLILQKGGVLERVKLDGASGAFVLSGDLNFGYLGNALFMAIPTSIFASLGLGFFAVMIGTLMGGGLAYLVNKTATEECKQDVAKVLAEKYTPK